MNDVCDTWQKNLTNTHKSSSKQHEVSFESKKTLLNNIKQLQEVTIR